MMKLDKQIHLLSWVQLKLLIEKFGKKAIITATRRMQK